MNPVNTIGSGETFLGFTLMASHTHEGVVLCIGFMSFHFKEDMTGDTMMLSLNSESLEPSFLLKQKQVTVNPHAT